MGNNQCEGCWWADKVQWDASQAPLDLATEYLGKCGQTDESRLGALPPKGRVTFSGDNMGLQWHRKHPPPLAHCSSVAPFLSFISQSFPPFRPWSLSANFPGPECCRNCLLPFHSVTGQKTWQSSKSLAALQSGMKWMKMWLGSTKENDYRQERNTAVHFLKCSYGKLWLCMCQKHPSSKKKVENKEDQWTTWDAEHILMLAFEDLKLSFAMLCIMTSLFPASPW